MELRWAPSALRDIDSAQHYIAEDNPTAAAAIGERILDAVEYLNHHPAIGRIGRLRGTREFVISGTPFIVIYRVRLDEIHVLRVLHHALKWS